MRPLSFHHLEDLYDELAQAIDAVGPAQESVFLAKLVLCLAQEWGDKPRISEMIRSCMNEPALDPQASQRLI